MLAMDSYIVLHDLGLLGPHTSEMCWYSWPTENREAQNVSDNDILATDREDNLKEQTSFDGKLMANISKTSTGIDPNGSFRTLFGSCWIGWSCPVICRGVA